MNTKNHRGTRVNTKTASLLIAACLVVNGCAAPGVQRGAPGSGGSTGGSGTASGSSGSADVSQVCNPFIIGLGAAALCGAIASGNNRVRTGAACAAAAVAACWLANSYKAEQTRNAKQVEDEYLQRNRQLPDRATVTAYRSDLQPRGAVTRGQQVQLTSTIVALPGRVDRNVQVEEELTIVDRQGEVWGKPVRKMANSGNEAGEYKTSFTILTSDGWSQGVYTVKRTLYVNGAVAQRDDGNTKFQVVENAVDHGLALAGIAPYRAGGLQSAK